MIDLPPPQPYLPVLFTTDNLTAALRSYGEACARAALEREVPNDWQAEYAKFKDGAAFPADWNALKVAFAVGMNFSRRAALEAREERWTLMSDVQVVRSAPSPLPAVLLDGLERTVLREGDCVIALRHVHK